MMNAMILEACVNSAISAFAARKNLQIPLFVMIRPRGGDFLYSNDEYKIMKTEILAAKESRKQRKFLPVRFDRIF